MSRSLLADVPEGLPEGALRVVRPVCEYVTLIPDEQLSQDDKRILNLIRVQNKPLHRGRAREALDEYIRVICAPFGGTSNRRGQKSVRVGGPKKPLGRAPKNANERRALEFKTVQKGYAKNKKRVAEKLLEGVPWDDPEGGPKRAEVEREYSSIFGSPSMVDDEPVIPKTGGERNEEIIQGMITEPEIIRAIRQTKTNAVGPDGLRPSDLRKIPKHRLVLLFNAMMLFGVVPGGLKNGRTVLIPKGGDPESVNSWRPITVGSPLLGMLHKILGWRLASVEINGRQRGFQPIDGVMLNSLTLQTIIKEKRTRSKPYNIISLDLRKAFDTVSHDSVLRALRRFSFGDIFIDYIKDLYTESSTSITTIEGPTSNIPIRRGVRQGDPLSPYLFNFVLDELLQNLEDTRLGIPVGETSCAVMAYADDLLLMADSAPKTNRLLKISNSFFEKRGMSINPDKCAALSINVNKSNKHMYTITRSLFHINGQPLKQLQNNDLFKYLGKEYGASGQGPSAVQELKLWLSRVRAAPLKPDQRLFIIKTYMIPRMIDALQSPTVTLKALKDADRVVRGAVRAVLHLNRTCADAYIHCPVRFGGLGVLSMKKHVPMIMRRRILGISGSTSELTNAILDAPYVRALRAKLDRWTGPDGRSGDQIGRWWSAELEGGYSGGGLSQGSRTEMSGDWISRPPPGWSGRDFCQAVQLRGNLLPTVGLPSNPVESRGCRAGCQRNETLCHVLQHCPASHWMRVRRHDMVVSRLSRIAGEAGWAVDVEPRIRARDQRLYKPDLTLHKDNELLIVDVGVSWEGPDLLRQAGANKMAKYGVPGVQEKLEEMYPGSVKTVVPCIVGARGIWDRGCNFVLESKIGLKKKHIKELVCSVIKGSLITHGSFMRSVARR